MRLRKKSVVSLGELTSLCDDNPWSNHTSNDLCKRVTEEVGSKELLLTALNQPNAAGFHAGANPHLSAKDRLRLAKMYSYSSEIGRLGLIMNPSVTQEELDILSANDDNRVRLGVVKHAAHRLSHQALQEVSQDHTVADELAQVPSLPEWVYRNLIAQDMPSSVWNLRILAENPSAPEDFLIEMVSGDLGYGDSFERAAILNPSTPIGPIMSIPSHLHVEAVYEVMDARPKEIEAWAKEEFDVDINLEEMPFPWVREMLSHPRI